MKFYLYLAVVITLMSCGSSQKARDAKENALFNKWLHKPKSLLVKTWGEPDSTVTDRKGGEILIYKEGIDARSVMNQKYTGNQFSFRKEIYVNADSLIYYWKTWRRK